VELGNQGDLFCKVMLPRHVSRERGHGRCPASLEVPCSGKCRFFLWLALRDKCWTMDRLEGRGITRPSACPFYDQAQESIAHLLLGCVLVRAVWVACLCWWDREDRLPSHGVLLADWLQSWCGRAADIRDYWTMIALVCGCLWRHQNDIVFEDATPSLFAVIRNIN
jgi:hypothetical protein